MRDNYIEVDANRPAIYNKKIVKYLESLEKDKGCAGVCRKATFYPFTSVENGPPFESCYSYII